MMVCTGNDVSMRCHDHALRAPPLVHRRSCNLHHQLLQLLVHTNRPAHKKEPNKKLSPAYPKKYEKFGSGYAETHHFSK